MDSNRKFIKENGIQIDLIDNHNHFTLNINKTSYDFFLKDGLYHKIFCKEPLLNNNIEFTKESEFSPIYNYNFSKIKNIIEHNFSIKDVNIVKNKKSYAVIDLSKLNRSYKKNNHELNKIVDNIKNTVIKLLEKNKKDDQEKINTFTAILELSSLWKRAKSNEHKELMETFFNKNPLEKEQQEESKNIRLRNNLIKNDGIKFHYIAQDKKDITSKRNVLCAIEYANEIIGVENLEDNIKNNNFNKKYQYSCHDGLVTEYKRRKELIDFNKKIQTYCYNHLKGINAVTGYIREKEYAFQNSQTYYKEIKPFLPDEIKDSLPKNINPTIIRNYYNNDLNLKEIISAYDFIKNKAIQKENFKPKLEDLFTFIVRKQKEGPNYYIFQNIKEITTYDTLNTEIKRFIGDGGVKDAQKAKYANFEYFDLKIFNNLIEENKNKINISLNIENKINYNSEVFQPIKQNNLRRSKSEINLISNKLLRTEKDQESLVNIEDRSSIYLNSKDGESYDEVDKYKQKKNEIIKKRLETEPLIELKSISSAKKSEQKIQRNKSTSEKEVEIKDVKYPIPKEETDYIKQQNKNIFLEQNEEQSSVKATQENNNFKELQQLLDIKSSSTIGKYSNKEKIISLDKKGGERSISTNIQYGRHNKNKPKTINNNPINSTVNQDEPKEKEFFKGKNIPPQQSKVIPPESDSKESGQNDYITKINKIKPEPDEYRVTKIGNFIAPDAQLDTGANYKLNPQKKQQPYKIEDENLDDISEIELNDSNNLKSNRRTNSNISEHNESSSTQKHEQESEKSQNNIKITDSKKEILSILKSEHSPKDSIKYNKKESQINPNPSNISNNKYDNEAKTELNKEKLNNFFYGQGIELPMNIPINTSKSPKNITKINETVKSSIEDHESQSISKSSSYKQSNSKTENDTIKFSIIKPFPKGKFLENIITLFKLLEQENVKNIFIDSWDHNGFEIDKDYKELIVVPERELEEFSILNESKDKFDQIKFDKDDFLEKINSLIKEKLNTNKDIKNIDEFSSLIKKKNIEIKNQENSLSSKINAQNSKELLQNVKNSKKLKLKKLHIKEENVEVKNSKKRKIKIKQNSKQNSQHNEANSKTGKKILEEILEENKNNEEIIRPYSNKNIITENTELVNGEFYTINIVPTEDNQNINHGNINISYIKENKYEICVKHISNKKELFRIDDSSFKEAVDSYKLSAQDEDKNVITDKIKSEQKKRQKFNQNHSPNVNYFILKEENIPNKFKNKKDNTAKNGYFINTGDNSYCLFYNKEDQKFFKVSSSTINKGEKSNLTRKNINPFQTKPFQTKSRRYLFENKPQNFDKAISEIFSYNKNNQKLSNKKQKKNNYESLIAGPRALVTEVPSQQCIVVDYNEKKNNYHEII